MERLADGNHPAEGVTLNIDQALIAMTDAEGHFRFPEVPEGSRKVALALHELPAEFDAGKITENAAVVLPGKVTRTDFDVIRLGSVQGKIKGPKGVAVDGIVIRMLPGQQYTTPDLDGNFCFYNVRAGTYTLAVDEKTLPQFGALNQPGGGSRSVQVGGEIAPVIFAFEIHKPEKPVRNVLEKK